MTKQNAISHHPDDASLAAYGAGTLNAAQTLAVAAHLEYCPRCAARQAHGARLGGALLESMEPAPLSETLLAACWSRIDRGPVTETSAQTRVAPSAPAGTETNALPAVLKPYAPQGLDALSWRFLTSSIRYHTLRTISGPEGWARLFLFLPGCAIPRHGHGEGEMTLVLRGAYRDELGCFGPGDLADLDTGQRHSPRIEGDTPCVALTATAGRVRFERPLHRLFAAVAGI